MSSISLSNINTGSSVLAVSGGMKTSSVNSPVLSGSLSYNSNTGPATTSFNLYQNASTLVLVHTNTNSGTNTQTALYLIRGYYDNSTAWASSTSTVIFINGSNNYTFGVNGNFLTVTGPGGNLYYKVIST